MDFNNYIDIIKKGLSQERFEHSLQVADTALQMAEGKAVERDKVYLAALLHDYAKDLSLEKLLATARDNGLITCEAEMMQPDLLHGPVGAWLCFEELGIDDQEVLDAIRYHTTGRAGMSTLEIIIYLADLIEPGRSYDGVEELREICAADLFQGLLFAFDRTLLHVLERKMLIHHKSVEARNWLLTQI